MLHAIGGILAVCAVGFDFTSYIKQISKTLRTKHSRDVSTTAYMLKIAKICCSTTALALFANWIGFSMEAAALLICLITLIIVAHFKPRNWRLF